MKLFDIINLLIYKAKLILGFHEGIKKIQNINSEYHKQGLGKSFKKSYI